MPTASARWTPPLYDPHPYKVTYGGRAGGKAQPLNAALFTRQGHICMGDVQVGTEVSTPFGYSTVRAIYPQGEQDIYKIRFSGFGERGMHCRPPVGSPHQSQKPQRGSPGSKNHYDLRSDEAGAC